MIEDQLIHDQRTRLECLAQAVKGFSSLGAGNQVGAILAAANEYEKYIILGVNNEAK